MRNAVSSASDDAEQQLVDALMEGYQQIRQLLSSDAPTNAYLSNLASHGYIGPPPGGAADLPIFQCERPFHSAATPEGDSSSQLPQVGAAVREVVSLASTIRAGMSSMLKYPLIAFMDFKVGDIALFMPQQVDNRKIWIAFNSSFPYRFLSDVSAPPVECIAVTDCCFFCLALQTSLDSFQANSKHKENRKYILGRIVLIDTYTAGERLNPYQLPLGTVFHVCHCEPLINKSLGGGVTSPSWSSSALMGVTSRTTYSSSGGKPSAAGESSTDSSVHLNSSLPAAGSSAAGDKK